jgi:hypothetical protein
MRRLIERMGLTHEEVGRIYSDRYTPGTNSAATVTRLLNSELMPLDGADRLATALDLHLLMVWDQAVIDNPIPVRGGLREYEKKRRREAVGV